jgi:cytochrome c-type biogenesis protein
MDGLLMGAALALWLGLLTSINPCPLATNIAAISFIAKRVDDMGHVLLSGFFYTLGRTAIYVLIGVLIVASALTMQDISYFLQKYMNQIVGPVLVVTGMLMLELVRLDFFGVGANDRILKKVKGDRAWNAGLLGVLFALSFCPISAAIFFGGLIPLSIQERSSILFPTLYGIGTALPVILFAVLIALGARSVGSMFEKVKQLEPAARKLTGVLFIAVGVYYSLRYIFNLL